MSFLANLFAPAAPQQQATKSPAQLPNGDASVVGMQQATLDPNSPANNQVTPVESHPLDGFKDLWQTAPTDPNKAPANNELVSWNQDDINKRVSAIDFTRSLPQDKIAAAMQGDAGAFSQVLNGAIQQALALNMQLTAGTVNAAGDKLRTNLSAEIPNQFRQEQLKSSPTTNPMLDHPAVQPMLQATRMQLAQKNPGMSVADVNRKADEYFSTMMSSLQNNGQAQQTQNAAPSTNDFGNFFN